MGINIYIPYMGLLSSSTGLQLAPPSKGLQNVSSIDLLYHTAFLIGKKIDCIGHIFMPFQISLALTAPHSSTS